MTDPERVHRLDPHAVRGTVDALVDLALGSFAQLAALGGIGG